MSALIPKGFKSEIDEFVYNRNNILNVGVGDTQVSPIILARWNVSNTSPIQQNFIMRDMVMYGLGEKLAGAGSIIVEFVRSVDNFASSINFIRLNFFGAFENLSGQQSTITGNTLTNLGVIAYNSDGGTSGTLQNITFFMKNKVPSGMKFTRVI